MNITHQMTHDCFNFKRNRVELSPVKNKITLISLVLGSKARYRSIALSFFGMYLVILTVASFQNLHRTQIKSRYFLSAISSTQTAVKAHQRSTSGF